jgi:hypothetical protein
MTKHSLSLSLYLSLSLSLTIYISLHHPLPRLLTYNNTTDRMFIT